MKTFIQTTAKHWKGILIITALTAISAAAFGTYFNRSAFTTTVFLSVGAENRTGISPYESVQAADQFAESIQGWFKNPSFTQKIASDSGVKTSLAARKQEKQNLVITYKTQTPEQGTQISRALEANLKSEISRYNVASSSAFKIALFSSNTGESGIPLAFFILCGIAVGLMLGYCLMTIFDRFMKELHEHRH
jgi:capsular polysaccharide biosynthesis protein